MNVIENPTGVSGGVLLSSYNLNISSINGGAKTITISSSSDIILPKYAYILYASNAITQWTEINGSVLPKCYYKAIPPYCLSKISNSAFTISAPFTAIGIGGTGQLAIKGDGSSHLLAHIYLQF